MITQAVTFPLTLLLDPVSSSDQEVDVVIDLICASPSDMVSFEKTVQAFIDADRHDLFSLSPGSIGRSRRFSGSPAAWPNEVCGFFA